MIIKLKDLLKKCLFNNGVFCRIDIPIRVMAVEEYERFGTINPLWWRMQYAKVWYQWGAIEMDHFYKPGEKFGMIPTQKGRLVNLVTLFSRGASPESKMIFGNNLALKDGAHRLACFIYFEYDKVDITVDGADYFLPEEEDPVIKELYTEDEWLKIQRYKQWLIKQWGLV